jgi:outer membrane lipoprotein carrier protein
LFAAALSASAQPSSDGADPLDAFLSGVQSLTADFKQEVWASDSAADAPLETATGSLSLKRPNRFRWTSAMPEITVVSDGTHLKIYDVELEQVTVAPFDDTVGTSPAMLLSGDRKVREAFDVERSYTREGLQWVELVPKTGGSDFTSVQIGFMGREPRRLELVDGLNHVTRIELVNVVVNPELVDETFELEVPDTVDVIGD